MAASVFTAEAQRTPRNSLNLCVLGVSAVSELFIIMLTNTCSGKVRSFLVHSSESYANYGESSNCAMSLTTTFYIISRPQSRSAFCLVFATFGFVTASQARKIVLHSKLRHFTLIRQRFEHDFGPLTNNQGCFYHEVLA